MESITNLLKHFFLQYGTERRYVLAFSGGLDSHVLVDVCVQLKKELELNFHVVHINHGLSAHADRWQAHCADVCAAYTLPFHSQSITVNQPNLEAKARIARYAALASMLGREDILLTAHHADDQAETLLLQLCRGAGTKGLAAMPACKVFAGGYHARPLLSITRQTLQNYALLKKLKCIEDESNQNTNFTRNFIRHEIIPLLQKRWPNICRTLNRSAHNYAEDANSLQEYLQADLLSVSGSIANTLSVSKLLLLSMPKQRLLIRAWLQGQGIIVPNAKKLQTIMQNILPARWDGQALLRWQQYEIRRHRDELYAQVVAATIHPQQQPWNMQQTLWLSDSLGLHVEKRLGLGIVSELTEVIVRFRQGGERIYLGKRGHKTLKHLFQEWGVVPWQRSRIPLVYAGERLIQVLGFCIDSDYAVKKNEIGNLIKIQDEF